MEPWAIAVWCGTVQFATVQCSSLEYITIQWSAVQYSLVQRSALYSEAQLDSEPLPSQFIAGGHYALK